MITFPIIYKSIYHTLEISEKELKDLDIQILSGFIITIMIVFLNIVPGLLLHFKFKNSFLWLSGLEGATCKYFEFDCENYLSLFLFALYFIIVNPGIEELF